MPTIDCELIAFKTSRPKKVRVTVDPLVLLLTAATVGMPTLASHPTFRRPLLEMQWRVAMVAANLRLTDSGNHWTRSAAYNRLDPSEKTSVSYFLGMTQAALMSRLVLGYPHLVHLDLLLRQQGTALRGSRPDFVAVDPSGTHQYSATVEAKGRTNRFDRDALDAAKRQAIKATGLHGHVPIETVGSEAYFNEADHWSSTLADPDWDGEPLDYGLETYLLVYYRNIIEAGKEAPTWERGDDDYQFAVPGFPLTIRLPIALVDAYERAANINDNAERDTAGHLTRAYRALAERDASESPNQAAGTPLDVLTPGDVDVSTDTRTPRPGSDFVVGALEEDASENSFLYLFTGDSRVAPQD